MSHGAAPRLGRQRGSSLIEFALVALALVALILVGIEFDRLALVYTTVANSARAGARYAIVHGSDRTGSGMDGPSGPGNTTNVETVIRNFASAGLLDTSRLGITVTYAANNPGSQVTVAVSYPYDPLSGLIPLSVTLGTRTTGIIAF
jgi:Flp pilus assembly protein TadG